MAQEVYVVIEFYRETDEFSEVECVFQSKEEAEDFAKECNARYLRYSYGCYEGTYDADEVDAVLAEKDDEIAELKIKLKVQTSSAEKAWKLKDSYLTNYAEAVKELYDKNKEIRHHKYKRCLAMARWCDEVMMSYELRGYAINRIWFNRHQWAMRWKYRWLELAEKFKEAK